MLIHLSGWRQAIDVYNLLIDTLSTVLGVHSNLFAREQKFEIRQQVGMLGQFVLILMDDWINRV